MPLEGPTWARQFSTSLFLSATMPRRAKRSAGISGHRPPWRVARAEIRNGKIGFVFQSFNLVPVLTAFENVEYPLWIDGLGRAERRRRTEEALASVGLAGRMHQRPDQLSGGERQRVALARGIVHDPRVILADEPTANLDTAVGTEILDLFRDLAKDEGKGLLVVTHDPKVRAVADRVVGIRDGRLAA
jgi:putative ABC transport system ATP-binding protein